MEKKADAFHNHTHNATFGDTPALGDAHFGLSLSILTRSGLLFVHRESYYFPFVPLFFMDPEDAEATERSEGHIPEELVSLLIQYFMKKRVLSFNELEYFLRLSISHFPDSSLCMSLSLSPILFQHILFSPTRLISSYGALPSVGEGRR
jgi:hypothetical protein